MGSLEHSLGSDSSTQSDEVLTIVPQSAHPPTVATFSEQLYGFSWSQSFPLAAGDQEHIQLISVEQALSFIQQHYSDIYELEGSAFPLEPFTPTKRRYLELATDRFGFFQGSTLYGVFLGNPKDWSSYYLRTAAFLPEHQGNGQWQKLLGALFETLGTYGVQRVEGDVSPSNLKQIHVFNKLGFNITGYRNSDRWGAIIHFTKYLSPLCEEFFLQNYCMGPKPQLAPSMNPNREGG